MDAKSEIAQVAYALGLEKWSWPRAMKAYKEGVGNGYTLDEFIKAAQVMRAGDKRYISLYTVLTKTDYWLKKGEIEKEQVKETKKMKGVW